MQGIWAEAMLNDSLRACLSRDWIDDTQVMFPIDEGSIYSLEFRACWGFWSRWEKVEHWLVLRGSETRIGPLAVIAMRCAMTLGLLIGEPCR